MEEYASQEVNDYRPQVIEHFVGQKQVVQRCKVALEAAWNQGTKLPHMLMQSGPGLGKTELSHILANEVGMEDGPHEQLAQNIKSPADLHVLLMTPRDKEICLIDEIHELPPIAQTTLYRAMENQQIFLESKKGQKSRPVKIANFTIIGATTDPQMLLQPLRDRFKLVLDFQFYTEEELEELLKIRVKHLGWYVDEAIGIPHQPTGIIIVGLDNRRAGNSILLGRHSAQFIKYFFSFFLLRTRPSVGLHQNPKDHL